MSRRSKISDPEFAKQLAEEYTSGMSQKEMYEKHGVGRKTMYEWLNDPRVTVHITTANRARENRMKRRIDTELERRLGGESLSDVPLETLLKIRKEVLPKNTAANEAEEAEAATAGIWDVLDSNPDLAAKIGEAMSDGETAPEAGSSESD